MEKSEARLKVLSSCSHEQLKKTMKHTSIDQKCAYYNPRAGRLHFSDYTFSYSRSVKKRKRFTSGDANTGVCSVQIFCSICLYLGSRSQIYPIRECNPENIIQNLG